MENEVRKRSPFCSASHLNMFIHCRHVYSFVIFNTLERYSMYEFTCLGLLIVVVLMVAYGFVNSNDHFFTATLENKNVIEFLHKKMSCRNRFSNTQAATIIGLVEENIYRKPLRFNGTNYGFL